MTRKSDGITVGVITTVLIGIIGGGCAAPREMSRDWRPLACFPNGQHVPRIEVYGRLGDFLPGYDATPALERFLYGPNDFGKTVLRNPQGMALLAGRLLVCDQGRPDVIAIDLGTGQSLRWGDSEHSPRCPVDVTVGPDGRVYVADTTLRSVLVYEATGGFVEELMPSSDPDRKFRPCAVLVDNGVLYVGNPGDRRVERWGVADRQWRVPLVPPETQPGLVAPTGLAVGPTGQLLIVDAIQRRVYRVRPNDGQWLEPIGGPGRGDGQFVRPKRVCCTSSGLIFVSDAGRQSVLAFDATGRYLTEIHERKDRWNGWTLPMGVLALRPAELAALMPDAGAGLPGGLNAYVIVSDLLGGDSLTVLGVTSDRSKEAADAG